MALGAMGMGTDFRNLLSAGIRPILLGGAASCFISGVSMALIFLGH
jgi:uncharacterized membrane protein YadS